jgi:integrase
MPRRRLPPRLYLDKARQQWAILDGAHFVRTGCAHDELEKAERVLADYIAQKYQPEPSPVPPVADVLLAYLRDKVPSMKGRSARYNVSNLAAWWSDKTLADVTAANCRRYASTKSQAAARADLERLAAAIRHWHVEYGPLDKVPIVWKPQRTEPRDRWLTRSQAARFLWEARRTEHLKRFVMIGLHTGSRAGVIRKLEWSWLDLERGTTHRAQARRRTSERRPCVSRAGSCTSYGAGTGPTAARSSTSFITTARGSSATFKPRGGMPRSAPDFHGCIRTCCGIRRRRGASRRA